MGGRPEPPDEERGDSVHARPRRSRRVAAPAVELPGLPASVTSLVGREPELALAAALLRRPDLRLLTLTGSGGIGKTRMVLRLAADLAEEFAEGAYFVSLASVLDPGLVATAIAQATGVNVTGSTSAPEALVFAFRKAEALLVVDNFEHVLDAAPLISDLLVACPRLKILVTSRVLLRVAGEHIIPVPPLALPDPRADASFDELAESEAVRLFAERAEAVDPFFALTETTAPLVAETCRRLDGLPLAIELAAARIRHIPVQALSDRLGRWLPLLTGGSRGHPSRLQTMRNAIAWSHDLLEPDVQTLFRNLAVFVTGFDLEAVEWVGTSKDDPVSASGVFDGLATLVDASLLQAEIGADGAVRYRMLETIREYALELAAENGETASAQQAHAAYFLSLAERNQLADLLPDGDRAMSLLEAEHGNIRAALGWMEESGVRASLTRLAAALGRFWSQQSHHYHEARRWLEAVASPESAELADIQAMALVHLGMIDLYQGAIKEGEVRLTAGLAACRQWWHAFHAAQALLGLGAVAAMHSDLNAGSVLLEESIAAAQEIPDLRLAEIMTGVGLCNLVEIDRMRGNHELAVSRQTEALRRFRDTGFKTGTILALVGLGNLACDAGDYAQALELFHEALALGREYPDSRVVFEVNRALAMVAVIIGQAASGARRSPGRQPAPSRSRG